MIELTDEEIKGKILNKLARKRKFAHSYMAKRDAAKGFPKHLVRKALDSIEEMVKDGLLLEWKRKKCVSINLEMKDEVNRLRKIFLMKKYGKDYKRYIRSSRFR